MRESVALLLVLVLLTTSAAAVLLPVKAVSKTIVVPDDYPTISSAIGNATAGDTVFVKKGTYEGAVNQTLVINKSISLIGEDANNTILNLYPDYTEWWIYTQCYTSYSYAITVDADDCKISGFTINTQGDILITGDRAEVISNNITTRPSASLRVNGSHCNITDNISSGLINLNNSFNVIALNSFVNIVLSGDSNAVSDNTCRGITVKSSSLNIISGNKVAGSHPCGIMVGHNSSYNLFYANYISGFAASVAFTGAENNTFYHNNFVNNADEPVAIYVEPAHNFWDNDKEGNYWDEYNGTDADRDGIGDTPYILNGDNNDNYPLMFPYDTENDTVVLPPPEPFPVTPVAVVIGASIALIGFGLLFYFRKRKHSATP